MVSAVLVTTMLMGLAGCGSSGTRMRHSRAAVAAQGMKNCQ